MKPAIRCDVTLSRLAGTLRPAGTLPGVLLLGTLLAASAPHRCLAASGALPQSDRPPAPLEVLVLGSGGPAALGRAASSYLVLLDGEARILVDAGPGSFARAGEAHASLAQMDIVLLTHLHAVHAAELPGFVKARAVSSATAVHFDVYGPDGQRGNADIASFPSTRRFIELLFGAGGAFAYLRNFSAPVTFTVADLPAAATAYPQPSVILARSSLTISAVRGHHGDAPAMIYRIDYRGRSLVFSGDIDSQGLPALQRLAHGANLLIFDAVVLDPPGSPAVLYSLHTPPAAIGLLAERSGAQALLLSHLSPAVEGARTAVAASIASHYQGSVTFAVDGMRLAP